MNQEINPITEEAIQAIMEKDNFNVYSELRNPYHLLKGHFSFEMKHQKLRIINIGIRYSNLLMIWKMISDASKPVQYLIFKVIF